MSAETEGSAEKKPKLSEDDEYDSDSPVENKFANDGSFMELFKKRMMEEQKDKDTEQKDQECKAKKIVEQDVPELKVFKAGIGKRKTLMKTNELREKRKRRREEQEEQKNTLEADGGGKTSAWKMYLSEVKTYEEQSCTDKEGFRRPLVK